VALLVVVFVFVLISIDPPQVLFSLFFLYALSGPVLTLITLRKRKAERHHHSSDPSSGELEPDSNKKEETDSKENQ
jgi:CDP-diacylglycerol--serine O-phosphatidyltransferase